MAQYTDLQWYVGSYGADPWVNDQEYPIGSVVIYLGNYWIATAISPVGNIPEDGDAAWESFTPAPQEAYGSSQFITLEDIVNNYMVMYGDEDQHGGMPKRMKIEAFAQRAVQEFSYDTFRVKETEYKVLDMPQIYYPQDLVEVVGVSWVDRNGTNRWMLPRKDSGNPTAFAYSEDENGVVDGQTFDSDGKALTDSTSQQLMAYDELTESGGIDKKVTAYYDYLGGYGANVGQSQWKRYYLDPEKATLAGTYVLGDNRIILEPTFLNEYVTLKYISDGIGNDLNEVQVHKFAEQAVYESIYFEMIARSNKVPANEKERAKRRMVAKKREAKLRLSPISKRELKQTLRAQALWFKN